MRFGFRKLLRRLSVSARLTYLGLCTRLFGFEYIKSRLHSLDKQLIIPLLIKYGARIGENCDIEVPLIVNTQKDFKNLSIGDNSHIGKNVILDLMGRLDIGRNVTISFGTIIISHLDVGESSLNTHYVPKTGITVIQDNVYVGAHSTILSDVTLGEACLVGAGSLVKDSFPSHTLICGNPAEKIREIE